MNCQALYLSVLSVAAFGSVAAADFITPNGINYPWTRGVSSNSAHAQWENFASVAGPNAPDAGQSVVGGFPVGAPAFNLAASGPGAVVLGSGNIYSGNSPLGVTITVPSFGFGPDAAVTTVLLQVRTQGTEINPATVLLNGQAPVSVTELARVSLGPQGAMVDTLWEWELFDSPSSYAITFNSTMQFFSLDRVAVDQFAAVPGPGTAALLGLGALAGLRRRR